MLYLIGKDGLFLEMFTWCPLEIFMVISAAIFLICSVIAPIINKKRPLTIIAGALGGVVGGAYLAICPAMLNELESNSFYNMPTDYFSDSHATYTVIFMVLIYLIALIGSALPVMCLHKKIARHKNKLFNVYAIVSAVSVLTFGFSLFTSYASFSNLVIFLPLNFAFSLFVSALSMLDCKINAQFIKAVVSVSVMLVIALGEMILLNSVSWIIVLIGLVLLLVPVLGLIAAIFEKRLAKSEKSTSTAKGN